MGYIKHHAIVVSSFLDEVLESAHQQAREIFGETVSEIVPSKTNGYYSFFIAPDGSKEGWEQSHQGDRDRAAFIDWVNAQAYEDKSNSISYAEIFYGEDNGRAEMLSHN